MQEPSNGVTKKSHWQQVLHANLIGRLTICITKLFMVPSIRDRDKGEMVHVNNLEEEVNVESMKQLEEPESNNPKNGRDVSRE